jgi:erythromycin esterase
VASRALTSSFVDLATLDPEADLADLEPLAGIVGDARVVAIGESTHYSHEFYLLRHRLARFLVERLGFDAIAFESGFPEAWQVDAWIKGGDGDLADVAEHGMTYMFGRCAEMRDQLSWLRSVNEGRQHPVRFYGIDLPASCGSARPALRAVESYLARADPAVTPRLARLRGLAASFADTDPANDAEARAALRAYCALPRADRDELTGLLADLSARFGAARLDYIERAGEADYDVARQQLLVAIQLDAWIRDYAAAAAGEHAFFDVNIRDAGMAQTTEWILERADRLVIMAHNLHIQRTPYALSWLGTGEEPDSASSLGHHLSARLGAEYLVLGTTFGGGEVVGIEEGDGDTRGWDVKDVVKQIEPPGPDVIDGLLDAAAGGPGLVDLRALSAEIRHQVEAASRMRCLDQVIEVPVLDAFDVLAHVPRVSLWQSEATAVLLGE